MPNVPKIKRRALFGVDGRRADVERLRGMRYASGSSNALRKGEGRFFGNKKTVQVRIPGVIAGFAA